MVFPILAGLVARNALMGAGRFIATRWMSLGALAGVYTVSDVVSEHINQPVKLAESEERKIKMILKSDLSEEKKAKNIDMVLQNSTQEEKEEPEEEGVFTNINRIILTVSIALIILMILYIVLKK